jgi:hypothetical protein
MKRSASCFVAVVLAMAALSAPVHAQRSSGAASASTADFTEGNLKFHRVASFIQVTDTTKNQVAGTIIVQQDGALMYAPMPGYDIKAAYEKHMAGGTPAAVPAASAAKPESPSTNAGQTPAAAAPAGGFDAATKAVTFADGRVVTFVDEENLKVQIPGTAGAQTYDLHYHGTSGGQMAQVWARSEMGNTGMGSGVKGPLSGGVTISLESANGLPGGKLYDTLEGGNLASGASLRPRLQPIVDAVREASEVVKPIQPKLADSKVVKTLLNNNLVR